ncbi:MAG TPA: hypothetical protein VFP65_16485 [Anaeromyxobacteraceae bacterium]|nr:hypothetical protein [Anaeromyxobacteraceae bacterium]
MTRHHAPVSPIARLASVGRKHRLEVVQDHGRTTPMAASRTGAPLFTGNGFVDYTCGGCAAVLCQRMRVGQLAGMVFRCGCGALNRVQAP